MDDFYKDAGLITQASDTHPNQSPHPNRGSGSAPQTKLGRSLEGEMNLGPTCGFSPPNGLSNTRKISICTHARR